MAAVTRKMLKIKTKRERQPAPPPFLRGPKMKIAKEIFLLPGQKTRPRNEKAKGIEKFNGPALFYLGAAYLFWPIIFSSAN